jgi:hypothetical protein
MVRRWIAVQPRFCGAPEQTPPPEKREDDHAQSIAPFLAVLGGNT